MTRLKKRMTSHGLWMTPAKPWGSFFSPALSNLSFPTQQQEEGAANALEWRSPSTAKQKGRTSLKTGTIGTWCGTPCKRDMPSLTSREGCSRHWQCPLLSTAAQPSCLAQGNLLISAWKSQEVLLQEGSEQQWLLLVFTASAAEQPQGTQPTQHEIPWIPF